MTAKTADRQLLELPIKDIIVEDENPRTTIAKKPLDELAASIREHGVLQPVLVEPKDGKHVLVAGYRRLEASKLAKKKTVPAVVQGLNGGKLAAAITENLLREDLTPLEEADAIHELQEQEGLSQRDLAKRLGKSLGWVNERLRLLRFPAKARKALGDGTLPLEAAAPLADVAKVAPGAVDAIADGVRKGDVDRRDVSENPAGVLDLALAKLKDAPLFRIPGGPYGYVDFGRIPLPKDVHQELAKRLKAVPEDPYTYRGSTSFQFGDNDVKKAKAAGCLLELDEIRFGRKEVARYITSIEFLEELVRTKVASKEREGRKRAAEVAKREKASESGKVDEAKRLEEERAAEERARVEAEQANLELGKHLNEVLDKPKIDIDVARVIAFAAIGPVSSQLAKGGLRFVDDHWHQVQQRGDGTVITFSALEHVEQALFDAIEKAKTPAAVFAVVLRALFAARFADPRVLSRDELRYSHGYSASFPGQHARGPFERFPDQVEQLAIAMEALPPAALEAAAARREAARRRGERIFADRCLRVHEELAAEDIDPIATIDDLLEHCEDYPYGMEGRTVSFIGSKEQLDAVLEQLKAEGSIEELDLDQVDDGDEAPSQPGWKVLSGGKGHYEKRKAAVAAEREADGIDADEEWEEVSYG
jgi:ParB/RepB/Spo0J family partition protein